jgi:hypothetical protein
MKTACLRFAALLVCTLATGHVLGGDAASAGSAAPHHPILNDTAMTLCLAPDGSLSHACAGTGQDGEFGRDVTHPRSRDGAAGLSFRKVCNSGEEAGEGTCGADAAFGFGPDDWGCTKDLVTGLVWELRTHDGSIRDAMHPFYEGLSYGGLDNIQTLVDDMNSQALCNSTSWRVPTRTELYGILDFGVTNDTHGFMDKNWFPDSRDLLRLWTSEVFANNDDWWQVVTLDGEIYPDGAGAGNGVGARLVHSTVAPPKGHRFQVVGLDVADTRTGLTWRRCAEGMSLYGDVCTGVPFVMSWFDALAWANAVASASGVAWRMPNAKELESLVETTRKPPIDLKAFPDFVPTNYWTSTPIPPAAGSFISPYEVAFGYFPGRVYLGDPGDTSSLLLVRDSD